MPFWDETSDESLKKRHSLGADHRRPSSSTGEVSPIRCARSCSTATSPDQSERRQTPTTASPRATRRCAIRSSGLVGPLGPRRHHRPTTRSTRTRRPNVALLNKNIIAWLTSKIVVNGKTVTDQRARQVRPPAWTHRITRCSPTPPRQQEYNADRRSRRSCSLESPAQQHSLGGRRLRRAEGDGLLAHSGRQRRHGRERHRRPRPDLLLPPLLRRPGVLALAAEAWSDRPAVDHRGLPRNQFGGQPGPDAWHRA